MLRSVISFFLFLLSCNVIAQHNIEFKIKSIPAFNTSDAEIYAAGSFNGWDPENENYKFKKDSNGDYVLGLKLNTGSYEFKITRGGWDKVECKRDGAGIENRFLKVESDKSIDIIIEEWQDNFSDKEKVITAGSNVCIIDTAFWMPQLNRSRRVWIYLPPDYCDGTSKRYPVLYMQDGQNVFDASTSYSGEWGVDEFMDTANARRSIIVAVDHGGSKRLNEYSPFNFSSGFSFQTDSSGEGKKYVEFLVKTLKPFIDRNFRTLKKKEYTFIAGSSMGGLISMYALVKYPKIFGGAGVFSPAFWVAPEIFEEIISKGKKVNADIYFYAGKLEGKSMVPDMLKAFQKMAIVSRSNMTTVIRDEGKHNEATWRREFPLFYYWIMEKVK